ncbi:MAG: hypothetical protein HQL82_08820 [Magnetococcales bacterium]|nr:hypothetical protein [Magnetococcales bacterium]
MLARDQLTFRNQIRNQNLLFYYCGFMSEGVLTGVGDALKRKLALDGTDIKTQRGIFSIFVEQMQNVIRYSNEREPLDDGNNSLSYGTLAIGREGRSFFILCANQVRREDVPRIEGSLKRLRTMDPVSLKSLYKETLRGDVPEYSKGAGVGFIDIARRASRPIEYDFADMDEQHAYFCLKAHI